MNIKALANEDEKKTEENDRDKIKRNPSYVDYSSALSFMTKIRNYFSGDPSRFEEFQKTLNNFQVKQQAIYKHNNSEKAILDIIQTTKEKIKAILSDSILYKEFEYFLPDLNNITVDMASRMIEELSLREPIESIRYKIHQFKNFKNTLPEYLLKLLYRTLNLYSEKIISYNVLIKLLTQLLKKNYNEHLIKLINSINGKNAEKATQINPRQVRNERKTTPSYIGEGQKKQERLDKKSTKSQKEIEPNKTRIRVHNGNLISVPGTSVERPNRANLRNDYDDKIQLLLDDRQELDVLININKKMIKIMENNEPENVFKKLGPTEIRSIDKMYGNKSGIVLNFLKINSKIMVKIVLERLKQKDNEWNVVKNELDKFWQRLALNKWTNSCTSFDRLPEIDKLKISTDISYLTKQLRCACKYRELHLKSFEIDEIAKNPIVTKSSLAFLVDKHNFFLKNAPTVNPPDFFPKLSLFKQGVLEIPAMTLNFSLSLEETAFIFDFIYKILIEVFQSKVKICEKEKRILSNQKGYISKKIDGLKWENKNKEKETVDDKEDKEHENDKDENNSKKFKSPEQNQKKEEDNSNKQSDRKAVGDKETDEDIEMENAEDERKRMIRKNRKKIEEEIEKINSIMSHLNLVSAQKKRYLSESKQSLGLFEANKLLEKWKKFSFLIFGIQLFEEKSKGPVISVCKKRRGQLKMPNENLEFVVGIPNPDKKRVFRGDSKWYLFLRLLQMLVMQIRRKISNQDEKILLQKQLVKCVTGKDSLKASENTLRITALFIKVMNAFQSCVKCEVSNELFSLFTSTQECILNMQSETDFWSVAKTAFKKKEAYDYTIKGLQNIAYLYKENCKTCILPNESLYVFSFDLQKSVLSFDINKDLELVKTILRENAMRNERENFQERMQREGNEFGNL